jgi:hypothetical protein
MKHAVLPRILRVGEAPGYLGMSRQVFDREVRPRLRVIDIGKKGKGVDRAQLDAIADEWFCNHRTHPPGTSIDPPTHLSETSIRCGRPAKKGALKWPAQKCQASSFVEASGGFGSKSMGMDVFAKALDTVKTNTKRRSTS